MSRLPTVQEVEHLLQQMLMNNTQQIQEATQHLIKYLKKPASVPTLFQLLEQSQFTGVRQNAAVLLRKKIIKHWNKLGRQGQEHIKRLVLDLLTKEPERVVRYSISTLISTIGRIVLPRAAGWEALFQHLFSMAQSADPIHRESSLLTLEALEEHIGDLLGNHFPQFYDLFKRSLQPGEAPIVQVAAIKCVNMLLPWLQENDEYVARFRDFIPLVVGVIQRSIAANKEDDATAGFEVLAELAESPSAVLEPYITDLTNFVLDVGRSTQLDFNIRVEALTVIQWIAQFKPGLLARHNLVRPTMQVAFAMAAEPDEDDDIPHDELTPRKFASQVIDCLTKYVEVHVVYPIFKEMVAQYFPSPDFNMRAAAVSGMTVAVEGCVEAMIPEVKGWIDYLITAFNDPHVIVRQLACLTLGRFAEWLCPEIYEYYELIMPIIYKALMEDAPNTQERACYALLSFVENLETEQSLPYMDGLISRLLQLLHTSPNRDVQEMCISAISAVASSTGKAFVKYWEPITQLLAQMQGITDENLMVLRSRAIECAGVIALAVGKEVFGNQNLDAFVAAALDGFKLDVAQSGDMREYVMTFFANIAECLKRDFERYLQPAMQSIATVLLSTEGVAQAEDLPTALAALTDDYDDGEEYEEDALPEDIDEDGEVLDEDALDDVNYSVQRSFLDEKLQALHAAGVILAEVGPAVMPYVENLYKIISVLKNYVHHDIRKACCFPLENMMYAVHRAYPPAQQWQPGMSLQTPLSPQARSFIDTVVGDYVVQINKDTDRETVSRIFDSIKTISSPDFIGVNALYPHMASIGKALVAALQNQLYCQDAEEEDEENESIETEQLEVFVAACDILMEWAKSMQPNEFMEFWEIVELLIPHLQHKKDSWRQEAMGALCEITNPLKSVLGPRASFLIEAAAKPLQDTHSATRSNAAYFVGLLFDTGGVNQYANGVSQGLINIMNTDTDEQCLDNSCGAYGRIVSACGGNMDLSGLPTFMSKLPLRMDMQEWGAVLSGLFTLFQQSNPAVVPHIPQTIHILTGLMGAPKALEKIDPQLQQSMVALVKHLGTSYPEQLSPVVAQLTPEQQQNYARCVNS